MVIKARLFAGEPTEEPLRCEHCQHESSPTATRCVACGAALSQGDVSFDFSASEPAQVGLIFEEKYEVISELGRGGMGVVYAALDLALGRKVAIKVLPEQFDLSAEVVARFKREARAMACLDHPNIVPVYAIGQQGRLHYFVMKHLDGETVRDRLTARSMEGAEGLPQEEALEALIQTCAGLSHAHERGLIHRDVKPGNLMRSPLGQITIMDFGIVKARHHGAGLTQTGLILGTPEYIAPEQAQGAAATPTSDIYALGIVGYEMLAGEPPFGGGAPFQILMRHINELPASLQARGISARLERVIFKALAKHPEDRFQSAEAMRLALERVRSEDRRVGARAEINREFATLSEIGDYAQDLSPTGCFIRSARPLPVGTMVNLCFTVIDSDLEQIEGEGEVVRVVHAGGLEPSGMGVRFLSLSPASEALLQRLLGGGVF
ncbi:protein kinase [Myxococcota bacterium]|nr:protein kinase [Myxococcota bacterium]